MTGGDPRRLRLETAGSEVLGDGFEESRWSSDRLVRSELRITHSLIRKEVFGGDRPQHWLPRSGGTEAPADELLRERLFGTVPEQREDARARMSTEDAPAGTGEEAVEEDLRTLWIDRDDQGQRFKEWKKVCLESSEERQADSPVAGPPSCLTLCKQVQHHGGNPKLWMHLWMKELGVSGKDRLFHEVTTLVEILHQGGTYDQLNVGAVASLEIASRRLIAIVEATSKLLDSPNWETARHYTGTSTIFDLAPP